MMMSTGKGPCTKQEKSQHCREQGGKLGLTRLHYLLDAHGLSHLPRQHWILSLLRLFAFLQPIIHVFQATCLDSDAGLRSPAITSRPASACRTAEVVIPSHRAAITAAMLIWCGTLAFDSGMAHYELVSRGVGAIVRR